MGDHLTHNDAAPPVRSTLEPGAISDRAWDAVVIGAGPAGSIAARGLAEGGRRVLLVDRSRFPREKVCGCCLAPAGIATLERLGLEGATAGAASMRELELRCGDRLARFNRRGYRVISRGLLDARLAAAARDAGAEILLGASARAEPGGRVRIDAGGDSFRVTSPAVVAADGIGGISLREIREMRWRVSKRSLQGAGATLERAPVELPTGRVVMCCGREGYLGLVRREDGTVDAAMAVRPEAMRELGGPAGAAARLIESCGGDTGASGDAPWRGTPMLTRRRRAASGTVFAIGDAAGYLEPFTGEGMSWAIESGAGAARLLCSGPIGAGGLDRAWRRRMARARRRRWACAMVAAALRSPRTVRAVIAGAERWPATAGAGAAMIGGARAETAS